MNNEILASFYNPTEKDLPIFFRQTIEGKGILQNIKFTSNNENADVHIVGTWIDKIDEIKEKNCLYSTRTT